MNGKQYYVGAGVPGTFQHETNWYPVSQLASGYELGVRVITVEGSQDGPTLGLTAGVHGDEHTGTEILRRVVTGLDPSQLKGRIRALPVVNPLAFEAMTRNTPLDMLNLSDVFPGQRDGWLSEQLAEVITQNYLPGLDYLIDLHAGARWGSIDYVIAHDDVEPALATGDDYIFVRSSAGSSPQRSMAAAARAAGTKGSVTFEFGGLDCTAGPLIEKGVRCVHNLMKHWGLLSGEPELPPRQYVFRTVKVMRPTQSGLIFQDPENAVIGQRIPKGALLGRVVSPYTFEILEEMRAPFEQNLVFHILARDGLIYAGDYAFQCADLEQTEIVENR